MSSEILVFVDKTTFCANRRAEPSHFSCNKSNTSLHNWEVILTFHLAVIFMNVNDLKLKDSIFVVDIFNSFTEYKMISSQNFL